MCEQLFLPSFTLTCLALKMVSLTQYFALHIHHLESLTRQHKSGNTGNLKKKKIFPSDVVRLEKEEVKQEEIRTTCQLFQNLTVAGSTLKWLGTCKGFNPKLLGF